MDKESLEIARRSLNGILGTAREFLEKLLGPAAEEAGLILGDKIKFYRLRNMLNVLEKSKRLLEEEGLSPKAVSLKTLFPLLEYASLEEDAGLQDKWAALLANAANSTSELNPSFPEVLKQLSSAEARLLDAIYDRFVGDFKRIDLSESEAIGGNVSNSIPRLSFDSLGLMYADLGLTGIPWAMTLGDFRTHGEKAYRQKAEIKISLQNLIRLGLLSHERDIEFDRHIYEKDFGQLPKSVRYREAFSLSAFGFEFVTACRKPKPEMKDELAMPPSKSETVG